jgi:hypothetical protein
MISLLEKGWQDQSAGGHAGGGLVPSGTNFAKQPLLQRYLKCDKQEMKDNT